MIRIRQDQLAMFESEARASLEERLVAYIKRCFPSRTGGVGDDRLREAIRHGLTTARSYGIISERHAARYISIAMVLGFTFDVHERLPWARMILTQPAWGPVEKLEALLLETRAHFGAPPESAK